jgi:hypothetical protein
MAVIDSHDFPASSTRFEERRCAVMFCMTWVGFFVLIGLLSYLVSMI